jgi:hypothetical protein
VRHFSSNGYFVVKLAHDLKGGVVMFDIRPDGDVFEFRVEPVEDVPGFRVGLGCQPFIFRNDGLGL